MLQFKFWLVNFQEIKIDFKKRTAAVKIWTEMNLYVSSIYKQHYIL